MLSTTVNQDAAQRLRHGVPYARREDIVRMEGTPRPGEPVLLRDETGAVLGIADVDLQAQPAVRKLGRPDEDPEGVVPRHLRAAQERRASLVDDPRFCRLVHDDGDGLPGLLVDRYDTHFVVQATSRAMEARAQEISRTLQEVTLADSVLLRNDGPRRLRAGLPRGRPHVLSGKPPRWLRVLDMGARLTVDLFEGRTVGYPYVLQRVRRMIPRLSMGARVLDIGCGVGSLFVQAGRHGARQILAFEESPEEADLARENADANGLSGRVSVQEEPLLPALAGLDDHFDLVLLDGRERDADALTQLLLPALRVTRHGGRMVVCATPPSLAGLDLQDLVADACERVGRQGLRLARMGAPSDFPTLLSVGDGDPLASLVLEVW